LAQLRGVAARSATVLATELFCRDLHNRREVGALTGLVPTPYRSGTMVRAGGVAPGGIAAVRRIAVDLAWGWIRYQPTSALTRWYHRRFGHGGAVARRIGIVAVARKLIIALWRDVTQGRLPEGALLKGERGRTTGASSRTGAVRAARRSISGGVAASGSGFRGSACETVSSIATTRIQDLVLDSRSRHA
jgi:transposase